MRIWKYQIKVTGRQTVTMPAGAKLLDIQMQNGAPYAWVLCDENASIEPLYLAIYGTGEPIPNDHPGEYIATFQMQAGDLVFHVFKIDVVRDILLLPCPFCGGKDLSCEGHYVQCDKCGAAGPTIYPVPSGRKANEMWNIRAR